MLNNLNININWIEIWGSVKSITNIKDTHTIALHWTASAEAASECGVSSEDIVQ